MRRGIEKALACVARFFMEAHGKSMNGVRQCFVRPWVWLHRIGHRRGYGVHSPFAYNFITRVVYEKTPYYKYQELREAEKEQAPLQDARWGYESLKVKRFLFRLVNFAQPQTLVDAGTLSSSSLYLKAGCLHAAYFQASERESIPTFVDFLYLHDYRHPDYVKAMFDQCLSHVHDTSVFVVEGIGYTSSMRELWKYMQQAERVGITFDLYDLGILFFDSKKIKQDYVVNF